MQVLEQPKEVSGICRGWREKNKVAFVPTMGALHEGHFALVKKAKFVAEKVVVSIFVNPLQFGPGEDLAKYPRCFEKDAQKLSELNIDLLFAPSTKEIYPVGFDTEVTVGKLASLLCGKSRPGHFNGVATVCLKLFSIVSPHFAIFGEKDFQQLTILRRMVSDLDLPLEIISHPIVREADGLAMSSRNQYLGKAERDVAGSLYAALQYGNSLMREDEQITCASLLNAVRERIPSALAIEYLELASSKDLISASPTSLVKSIFLPRVFVAAKIGSTRLIDNLAIEVTSQGVF